MPMLIEYRGSLYPSLSLALIQLGYKYTEMAIQPTAEGADLHFQGKQPLRIPLDSSGQMLIHFRGKAGSYPSYSAARVLSPQFKTTVFKEKIVLIGSSAGGLKDMHATPFDPDFIGVEAHTAAIDTVMSRDFLFFPSYSILIQCLIFAGTGILMTGWLSRYRAGSGVLVFGVLALGILGASSYWFTRTGQHACFQHHSFYRADTSKICSGRKGEKIFKESVFQICGQTHCGSGGGISGTIEPERGG
jgi:adenylate cyclase